MNLSANLKQLVALWLKLALDAIQSQLPQGRKLIITPPPVKVWAEEHNIVTIQPETLTTTPKEIMETPDKTEWDLFVVVSFGKILTKEVLDIPLHKVLNVHPSLLPKLRGASPIQSAILQDMKETGVTIMLLDDKMDHGPILSQASVSVDDWPPTYDVLESLLASVGGELLAETILPWINGDITPEEQNHEEATYVEKISKEDGKINLEENPYENYLKIQALKDWPGTFFFVTQKGKDSRIKISSASYSENNLVIEKVIPEGKQEMDYEDFKRNLS